MVKMVLDVWHARIKAANGLLEKLTDDQLMHEVAPGKNRGIYLLGHLTAAHDSIMPLLGFGAEMYPALRDIFITQPDKAVTELPAAAEVKMQWKNVNEALEKHMGALTADEWFGKHNSVSAEDFEKEPHRNKLNVILTRSGHLSYHMGQMALLKGKE
jgi:hypothetical protein